MAEILNQAEIDALLSEIDPRGATDHSREDRREGGEPVEFSKVIRVPKREIPRSYNPYRSPVIKARLIVIDPAGDVESGPHGVVVRTLANYAQLRKKRTNAVSKPGV